MATPVSQPLQLSSALRCVEYKFSMPSVGVYPEEKYFIYRLINDTTSQPLTAWKYYKPVANGQQITINFVKDLQGIVTTPKPNLTAAVPYTEQNLINAISVEYGERTVNIVDCTAPVDVVDGTTPIIDVVNGIRRHQQIATQADILANRGIVLCDRAKRYSVSRDAADFIYVIGSKNILLSYYTASNVFISSQAHTITQPYPGSICTVVPIGFNIAPAGTAIIHVSASNSGTPNLTSDLLFTLDNNFYAKENGSVNVFDKGERAMSDLYFQNNFGGFDLLSFESIESMAMTVSKQEIIKKFDCATEYTGYATDQRLNINNQSYPTITFKRTWGKPLTYKDQRWLGELAASNNVWVKEYLDLGFSFLSPVLLKFQLTNSEVQVRSGTASEFVLSGYYSEVFLFPN